MVQDYTRQKTINTTGVELIKFDVADLENVTIMADADWLLFFDSVSGSGFKVLANSAVELGQNSFSDQSRADHKIVTIYGQVTAGSTTASIAFMGKR